MKLFSLSYIPFFLALTGTYEPSGVQQLPDGRFIVVEDEKDHSISLVTLSADNSINTTPLNTEDAFGELSDMEGITLDRKGYVYAITSHSRSKQGKSKKSREKLIRFRIEGDKIIEPRVATELKSALTATHPILAAAADVLNVKTEGGLNIEGFAISDDQQRLLIGFRSPLIENRAIIATVDNPSAMFEAGEQPHISPNLDTLDLGGFGIRGMSYIESLGGYLIISGSGKINQFQLWFWGGKNGDQARRVTVQGLQGFAHSEGVSSAMIKGRQKIIFVSDDGSREEERFGQYLILDPDQLQIAP